MCGLEAAGGKVFASVGQTQNVISGWWEDCDGVRGIYIGLWVDGGTR